MGGRGEVLINVTNNNYCSQHLFCTYYMPSNVVSILYPLAHLFKSRFMGFQKMALLKDQIHVE